MAGEPTDDHGESLIAALEADGLDDARKDEGERTPPDVRTVLDEIGAEEAIAHLEARVAGLEQELERRDARQREADRGRRGETDLMRARIDDALELVKSSMDEQREAWSRFETRFVELVSETDETARSHISEMREELTPRVEDALLRLEETEAQLRGELRATTESAEARSRSVSATTEELRERVRSDVGSLAAKVDQESQARSDATARLEQLVEHRLEQLENSTEAAVGDLREQLGALRRELDSAVGELRAGLGLRGSELEGRITEVEEGLAERLGDEVDGLEQRWIEGTRDIARRIELAQREFQQQLTAERDSRRAGVDETAARIDEVAGVVEELHAVAGNGEARRRSEDEQVRRELDELASRLDVLQSKVASAVGQIASQLTNRVATLSAEQKALRETAVRREERFAAIEGIEEQIAELGRELRAVRDRGAASSDEEARQRLAASLADVREQLSGVAGTVQATDARLGELGGAVERLSQDADERASLRHEVRELTARSSELSQRLDETERLARAAGKAIASAVRRAKNAQQAQPSGESLFFRPDTPDAPSQG